MNIEHSPELTEIIRAMITSRAEFTALRDLPFVVHGYFKSIEKEGETLPTVKEGKCPVKVVKAPPLMKAYSEAVIGRVGRSDAAAVECPDYVIMVDRYTYDNCGDVERRFFLHNAVMSLNPVPKVDGTVNYGIRPPDFSFFAASVKAYQPDEIRDLRLTLQAAADELYARPARLRVTGGVDAHTAENATGSGE